MNSLASHWGYGPGPWFLFVPLFWVAVVAGVVTLMRRGGRWRGRGPSAPWTPFAAAPRPDDPVTLLGRRFALGEIDEDEYWRRMSVLNEVFGTESDRKSS